MPAGSGEGGELVAELKAAIGEAQQSGLSLSDLAKQSGVSPGQLSRFVRGERDLSLASASKLLTSLGLRVVKAVSRKKRKK